MSEREVLGQRVRDYLAGGSLIVASNRGPFTFSRSEQGHITAERSPGGLVTALLQLGEAVEFTWLSTPVSEQDRALRESGAFGDPAIGSTLRLGFVDMPDTVYRLAYDTIATRLFYFHHHHLFDLAREPNIGSLARDAWGAGFDAYAGAFAHAIGDAIRHAPGSVVMLHDPHMYLVAPKVRRTYPQSVITHFSGIPFPDARSWSMLPRRFRDDVFEGLVANDVVGFQTRLDAEHFLQGCARGARGGGGRLPAPSGGRPQGSDGRRWRP